MSQDQQSKLGNLDYSDQKLIGRDSELRLLKSLCKKSAETRPIAVFVRGPSGSGKSLLVNTAFDGKDDILFLTGKFDQYRRSGDAALSVIVEAFSELNNKMNKLQSTCSATEKTTDEKALLQIIPSLQAASSMGQSWGVEMLKQIYQEVDKATKNGVVPG